MRMCVLECATNSRRAATAGAGGEQEHRSAHQRAAVLLRPLLGSTGVTCCRGLIQDLGQGCPGETGSAKSVG